MKHKSTWHVVHFILTILFFPWAIIWIGCWASNANYNSKQKLKIEKESLDVNKELLQYLKNK